MGDADLCAVMDERRHYK